MGLFISNVSPGADLHVGDQLLAIAGQDATNMTCPEALAFTGQPVHLKVTPNLASEQSTFTMTDVRTLHVSPLEYYSLLHRIEYESFYVNNMGSLYRVINCILYPNDWLAWSVHPQTGLDCELHRIPIPNKVW